MVIYLYICIFVYSNSSNQKNNLEILVSPTNDYTTLYNII